MDFTTVASQLLSLGLPALGNALFGPLGGAAASLIAKALGAPAATPEAINATLSATDRDVAIQRLKSAEAEWIATVQSQTELGRTQMQEVGQTIRAELEAAKDDQGWSGRFIQFLQLSWRPAICWQTIVECTAGGMLTLWELWSADTKVVNMVLQFQSFLIFYFSAKFALMGVYVAGRSAEKISNATDAVQPSVVTRVIDAIKSKAK